MVIPNSNVAPAIDPHRLQMGLCPSMRPLPERLVGADHIAKSMLPEGKGFVVRHGSTCRCRM
ncbi:hypothetical protein ANO14919_061080 [Xylariales sp. No.14919]|nr:hypothetical protein ANO14919_061080 [Xylariales sp. No.14919]